MSKKDMPNEIYIPQLPPYSGGNGTYTIDRQADVLWKYGCWEYVYNCIRPRQALGYKTPLQLIYGSHIISLECL